MIDGKRLRISEYKQLLKAKKLADCGGGGRTGRHHQMWRDAAAAKAASSPGAGAAQYHGDAGPVNGIAASAAAAAAAAEPFSYSTHHCSPCAASNDSAYGRPLVIITLIIIVTNLQA